MVQETIHENLYPAYFKVEKGEKSFMCINPAGYDKDGINFVKSAHVMRTHNGELLSVKSAVYYQAMDLKIGESFVDGVTIIVRIS